MKIYIVCEHYTCFFCGIYNNAVEAEKCAEESDGFIEEYSIENGEISFIDEYKNGKIIKED